MTYSLTIIICLVLGLMGGWQLNDMRRVAQKWRDLKKPIKNVTEAEILEGAWKWLEESNHKFLDQFKHPDDCPCAVCEIRFGSVGTRDQNMLVIEEAKYDERYPGDPVLVRYRNQVKALEADKEGLNMMVRAARQEIRDLRTELKRRDELAKNAYPILPKVGPNESYSVETGDGATVLVRGQYA